MRFLLVFTALSFAILSPSKSYAQSNFWTGALTNNWNTAFNWNPGSVPGAGTSLGFGNADNTTAGALGINAANSSITLSGAQSGSIVFFRNTNVAAATPSYVIGQNSAQVLTISGGSSVTVDSGVAATQTIRAAVASSGTLNILNNSTSSVLNIESGISGTSQINVGGVGEVRLGSTNASTFAGNITVQSGVTLGGVGVVSGGTTVQSGATLSPGLGSVGTQSFNGLTFSNNGTTNNSFAWDLNGASFDSVDVNGVLSVGTGFRTRLNLTGLDPLISQSWNVFTDVTSVTGLSNLTGALISLNTPPAGVTSSNFSWGFSGTNVTLSFTAVPEPSSMALLGVAGLVGGVYARRRQKLAKKPAVAC